MVTIITLINILTILQDINKEGILISTTLKTTTIPNPVDQLTARGIQEDLNFLTNQATTGRYSWI